MRGEQDNKEASADPIKVDLVHPIYLDVPMMISFIAALEGGASQQAEVVAARAVSFDRDKTVTTGLSLANVPLAFDMTGRIGTRSSEQESQSTRVIRQHTAASLFNVLRDVLVKQGRLENLAGIANQRDQKGHGYAIHIDEDVSVGQLLEVWGRSVISPLDQVLDTALSLLPYLNLSSSSSTEETGSGIRLLKSIKAEVDRPPVTDLIMDTEWPSHSDKDTIRIVLTAAREFLSSTAKSYLLDGRFGVIGKVTRVLESRYDDKVDLTRRTALGPLIPNLVQQLAASLEDPRIGEALTAALNMQVSLQMTLATQPELSAPAIQLIPLAIFA